MTDDVVDRTPPGESLAVQLDAALKRVERGARKSALLVLIVTSLRWSIYSLAGIDVLRLVVFLVLR